LVSVDNRTISGDKYENINAFAACALGNNIAEFIDKPE